MWHRWCWKDANRGGIALKQLDCFDAVFWLHADDTTKLAKDFGDISLALGLEKVASDQAVSKDLVLEWLCRPHNRRSLVKGTTPDPKWLLIFDNADNLDVLADYLPVSGNGSILVTSRDPLAKTKTRFRTTAGIDLESFSNRMLESFFGLSQATTMVRVISSFPKR